VLKWPRYYGISESNNHWFHFLGEKSKQRTSGSSHLKNPKQTTDFMKELVVNKVII
jgi:hypothetical protein